MWKKWLAFTGMLAMVIMLDPTHTPAQPPGKGGKGGGKWERREGGNGPGGMTPGSGPNSFGGTGRGPGGMRNGFGGTGSGAGAPSGGMGNFGGMNRGPGGGMGGGMGSGGRGMDPELIWKMMSDRVGGDGQTVDLNKLSPQGQGMFKMMAERTGTSLPANGILSKADYLDFHARSAASTGNGGNPMDRNRGPGGFGQGGNRPGFEPKQTEEERPVAMRYGKLPKGLPGWYDTYDTDKDGQVSLYEWRKAKEKTEDFTEMDLNGDGLITADEYLRFARQKNIDTKVAEYEDGLRGPGDWGLGEKLGTGNEQPTRPNNGKGGGFGGFGGQKGGDNSKGGEKGGKGGKKSDWWQGMKKN